jgi:antitoxin ParD1/3/4
MMPREVSMAAASNLITVDLGPLRQRVEKRVQSGLYKNAAEVIRAGLEALDREEADNGGWSDAELIRLANESLTDPEPCIPAEDIFRELHAIHLKAVQERAL